MQAIELARKHGWEEAAPAAAAAAAALARSGPSLPPRCSPSVTAVRRTSPPDCDTESRNDLGPPGIRLAVSSNR